MTSYRFLTVLAGFAFLLTFSSCKKELAGINTNPNAVEHPQPSYLLTGATKTAADVYWNVGGTNPSNLFVQYWAAIQYTDQDRYIFSNSDFQDLWTDLYSGSIVNLDKIIDLAGAEDNPNYKGVALILRAWMYCLLTDAYGNIPYSESIQIDENITPGYDTQQKVYEGLLSDLKTAQDSLDADGKPVEGDIIYGGDIARWKKLDNSLRLRIALRIADREPEKAAAVIKSMADAGGNYIGSNSESAELKYQNTPPNDNPLAELFLTRDDYRISKTIVDRLFQLNDPRLPVYAAPTQDPTPQTYVGIPNGLLVGQASELGFTKTSRPGAAFLDETAPAVIMSYAEVLFDRAEAAARGFTAENAADLYKAAVTASLQQHNIDQGAIDKYLSQPALQYDPGNFKKSIGVQKWIALFGQGLEAFAEWRRLDYPQLKPAVAGVLNGKMPLRFIYPGTEQSLNKEGYRQAVADQGADVLTTSLWFDVN
ncbi:SusD/RagB family nutrient-binding outer membrane lipoprotein [Compostibacter hankyongensis]|uniref:SusD/RagB family nutrient-binding outer membrane lipoprotein n=1 Tax=Compostibacter hankyongensis TaxID=1007089 RepID=A0ABP8GAR8_9BACT